MRTRDRAARALAAARARGAAALARAGRAAARGAGPAARRALATARARPDVVLAAGLLLGVLLMVVHWAR